MKIPPKQSLHENPGSVLIGEGKPALYKGRAGYRILFCCRKGGWDYLGQLKIVEQTKDISLELFNESYYSHFRNSLAMVCQALKIKVLRAALENLPVPQKFQNQIHDVLERPPMVKTPAIINQTLQGKSRGKDLQEIMDRLNKTYFEGRICAQIEWGRNSTNRNLTSIRFGSYHLKKRRILIHPRLRQDFVPQIVLELTIYHEMCHQYHPPIRKNGRTRYHHAAFKQKEREYLYFQQAREWEQKNWRKLLLPPKV